MPFECPIHGVLEIDYCDDCKKVISCNCTEVEFTKVKDIHYDCEVGEKTVTIDILHCATCGSIHDIRQHIRS